MFYDFWQIHKQHLRAIPKGWSNLQKWNYLWERKYLFHIIFMLRNIILWFFPQPFKDLVAIQKQVAGWIWPINCSLPTPVLKQQTTWNTVHKLQIDFQQWASKQSVFATKQRCSTWAAAAPREPANRSASLSRWYWPLSLLSLSSQSWRDRDSNLGGAGEWGRESKYRNSKGKKTKTKTTQFTFPHQFSGPKFGPIWGKERAS